MVCSSEQLKNEFYRSEKDLNMAFSGSMALRHLIMKQHSDSLLSLAPALPRYMHPCLWNHPAYFHDNNPFDVSSHNFPTPFLHQFSKISDVPLLSTIKADSLDEPLDLIVRPQSPHKRKCNSWTPDSGIGSPPICTKELDAFKYECKSRGLRSPPPLIAKPIACHTLKEIPPLTPITTPSTTNSYSEALPSLIPSSAKSCPSSPSLNLKRGSPGISSHSLPTKKTKPGRKGKIARKLNFDEKTTSPVSGTIIRKLEEGEEIPQIVRKGDIDPAYNVVEVTDEAKAELAKIENKIGDYVCKLCKCLFEDAFGLAQHRCAMIVHVEYRCPDCDKLFNCPANLASHRRWHRPRPPKNSKSENKETEMLSPRSAESILDPLNRPVSAGLECSICYRTFSDEITLNQHVESHIMNFKPNVSLHHAPIFHPPLKAPDGQDLDSYVSPTQLICHICRHIFSSKVSLQEHYQKGCAEDVYPCNACSLVFYSAAGLTRHVNKDHLDQKDKVNSFAN